MTRHRRYYAACEVQSTAWLIECARDPSRYMNAFCVRIIWLVLRHRGVNV